METEKYRFDQYDSVFEFDREQNCYFFIGKLNGQSEKDFISEYEEELYDY